MNSDLSNAKVGDWIWTIKSGWNRIEEIKNNSFYPISAGGYTYTFNGKFDENDAASSAFLIPPTEFCSDPPPCEFRRGDKVIVWNTSDRKHRRYFSHIGYGLFNCYIDGKTEW